MSGFLEEEVVGYQGAGDTKAPLEALVSLRLWVETNFKQLSPVLQADSSGQQYLQVSLK